MEKSNFNTTKEIGEFTKSCMMNSVFKEEKEIFLNHWAFAQTVEGFKTLVFGDERLFNHQAYAELSKETSGHTRRILDRLDNIIMTDSEAGGLKIGNNAFSIVIPNGKGDGTTKVSIVEKFNRNMLEYFTTVEGDINIYSHDCGDEVVRTIDGIYSIYYHNGIIIFVRED